MIVYPVRAISFDIHGTLLEQVAKFRAARRLWARIMKERFGAKKPMQDAFPLASGRSPVPDYIVRLGGYGFIEEYPVARFYRDAKILEVGEGTSEVQRIVLARAMGLPVG